MLVYVLSDLHGEIRRFFQMLELIEFTDEDIMYIIGDVLDRCEGGIEILLDIMSRHNISLIKGNHEDLFLQAIKEDATPQEWANWRWNGGNVTEEAYQKLSKEDQNRIVKYLEGCPVSADIAVSGRKFHLVHAWPGDEYDCLWSHPYGRSNPFPDKTLIIGHTVTARLSENAIEDGKIVIYPRPGTKEREQLRYLAIDCGAGHLSLPGRQLACLRLDDFREFYV